MQAVEDPNIMLNDALQQADINKVRYIVANQSIDKYDKNLLLMYSLRYEWNDIKELMLGSGAIDFDNSTNYRLILNYAVKAGHIEMIRRLLKNDDKSFYSYYCNSSSDEEVENDDIDENVSIDKTDSDNDNDNDNDSDNDNDNSCG